MNAQSYFEERNLIQANPDLKTLRTLRYLSLFLIASVVAVYIISLFIGAIFDGGHHFSNRSNLFTPIFLPVLYTILIVMTIRQERYWKRIEQGRFAAVRGDQTLLALGQPIPDATAMRLPITIKLRRSKKFLLVMTVGVVFAAALVAGWFDLVDATLFTSNPLLNFLIFFSIMTGGTLGVSFALYFSPLGRQQIKVTESGLTASYGGRVNSVQWE